MLLHENKYHKKSVMRNIIKDIREKIDILEKKILENDDKHDSIMQLNYINLSNGSNEEKLKRIIEQLESYNINIMPTSKERQIIRAAIIAEFGEHGFAYWIRIRSMAENYDLQEQYGKYNNLLTQRNKNTMTFGAIVNRYRQAIDRFNENNKQHI